MQRRAGANRNLLEKAQNPLRGGPYSAGRRTRLREERAKRRRPGMCFSSAQLLGDEELEQRGPSRARDIGGSHHNSKSVVVFQHGELRMKRAIAERDLAICAQQ